MAKPSEAQQNYAGALVKPPGQLVEHWQVYRCGDEALLCRHWGLSANRGLMLLGELASQHRNPPPATLKTKLSLATRAKNEPLTPMTKLKGGEERQQESRFRGYSIPWGFGLRESNYGDCPGGLLVGVQLLCLPWWRHLEWLSGLQERKLVNTTDKPCQQWHLPLDHGHVWEWLVKGSDPIGAKYYEDSPINT